MKTIYLQTKAFFSFRNLFTATILLTGINGFSQDTTCVWVTVTDNAILNAKPESAFGQLVAQQNVISVQKAFPNAHTPSLQKVYELQCRCNNYELERLLLTIPGTSKPVAIEKPKMLDTPDDYNMTFAPDYALDLINAQQAWDYTHGDTSVILGITDENYDFAHEELAGKVVAGTNTGYPSVYHGTAVAVTAAGNTNNGMGKSSIGYNCRLALFMCAYNELLVARDNGARVVNASWHDGSCGYNAYCQEVIDELYNDGIVVVASAGNGTVTCGTSYGIAYPASYNHVISVTSVGPNDNHERYPGDTSSAHQHNAFVDLSAPGYDVPLTVSSGWYLTGNGSSFAAPFVTGTVGLMLSVNSDLTVDEVEYILKETSVNIDSLNPTYAGLIGTGRLNAGAAVAMAAAYDAEPTPAPTPEPEPSFETAENAYEASLADVQQNTAATFELKTVKPVIYPNPSNGDITIAYAFQQGQTIEIIDLTGRSEQFISVESAVKSISPEHLSQGAHHVIFREGGRIVFQQKVIVI